LKTNNDDDGSAQQPITVANTELMFFTLQLREKQARLVATVHWKK